MSKSQVNQTQVHTAVYANVAVGAGMESLSDLLSDINAARSLIKDIKGSTNWYDATTQSQAAVYGALHVAGSNAEIQGELNVLGVSTFNDDVNIDGNKLLLEAGALLKIVDLAHAGQILFPNETGEIGQSSDLVFNAASTLAVGSKFTVTVADGAVSAANGNFTVASDGAVDIGGGGVTMSAAGLVHVGGDFDVATSMFTVNATSGDAVINGTLRVNGDAIKNSGGSDVITFISSPDANSVQIQNSLNVLGDLHVKGATTYVETENLIVKDAFIHLATSSTGMTDSGIVLHTAADDLIVGRNGDDSEFIFASQDVEAVVDSTNDIEMAGSNLVKAWMAGVKVSDTQGSADLGQLSWLTPGGGGDAYLSLTSSDDARLVPANDLYISTQGGSAFRFNTASSSQSLAAFEAVFGASTTLIGAIMAAGSAGANKVTGVIEVSTALIAGASFDISSVGALRETDYAAYDQVIQVFVNGLRQSAVLDYAVDSESGDVSFSFDLVDGDVVIVSLSNAAL